jgi:pSer/pThr/pTyr-binding forkhead associated (FHA) protein
MDLNSANGTFVNSRRISNHVLSNADVIRIGQHGLKYIDPRPRRKIALDSAGFNDTVVMKTIEDMRRILARENTEILPAQQDAAESGGD